MAEFYPTPAYRNSLSTADVRDVLGTIPVKQGSILPLTEYGDGSARFDIMAGVPGSIINALTAPARAYRGEIPEDQMIPEGLNFAGSVALGSAAVPRPMGSVGMESLKEGASHLNDPLIRQGDLPGYSGLIARIRERGMNLGNPRIEDVPMGNIRPVQGIESQAAIDDMVAQGFRGPSPGNEPLLYKHGDTYYLADGRHRFAAAEKSGLDVFPGAKVRDIYSNPKESAVPGTLLSSSSHLDMSPEARMARAREMGFDTETPYYHGTGRDVEAFDLSKARDLEGRRRGLGNGAGKVYLDPNPETAGRWAMEAPRRNLGSDPNVMPLYVRGELADDAVWQDAFKRLSGGRPSYDPALGMKERDGIIKRVDAELQGQGFSGIQTRYRNPDGSVAEIGQTAVFDPNNIRSVNAAFDPAKSHSANLLAANPETSSAPGLGLMAAAKQEPKGFTAYHGSPHDFDRFDMSKIGTGEGAQAYGHGLYFADSEGVARSYRDGLSDIGGGFKNLTRDENARVNYEAGQIEAGTATIDDMRRMWVNEIERRKSNLGEFFSEGDVREAQDRLAILNKAGDLVPSHSLGKLYQVRINADPDHFLDWDKPLSQQSEAVRKAVESYVPDNEYRPVKLRDADAQRGFPELWVVGDSKGRPIPSETIAFDNQAEAAAEIARRGKGDVSGAAVMQLLGDSIGGSQKGSNALRDAGIPGIKYLDQGSRAAGEGSRNYVVFDDKLIDILKKYGLLGMMGGGMAASNSMSDSQL